VLLTGTRWIPDKILLFHKTAIQILVIIIISKNLTFDICQVKIYNESGGVEMKFGHIGIKVLDMEDSLAFYEKVLHAKILKDYQYPESRLVFLDVGGTVIELIAKDENQEREPGPIEHIAFKVDSLTDKMKLLKTLGIEHSQPRVVGTAQIIFFDGPNNEKFEFVARI